MIAVECQADLFEIIFALGTACSFASLLNGGQEPWLSWRRSVSVAAISVRGGDIGSILKRMLRLMEGFPTHPVSMQELPHRRQF